MSVQIHFVTRVALFIGSKPRDESVVFYRLTLDKHSSSIHVPAEASFSFQELHKICEAAALPAEYTKRRFVQTLFQAQ